MKEKKILVFGAAGFIGTYLVDELVQQGHSVTASDISPIGEDYYSHLGIPYIHVDITSEADFEKLPQTGFDSVIVLAALQPATFSDNQSTPKDYININVVGTVNILEYCRKNNVRQVIYGSSHRNTHALWQKNKAIKESDGRGYTYGGEYSMFCISETAAQDCVEYYSVQFGLQGIIFRLPPVYGFGPHLEIFKEGKPVKTGFQTFIDNAMECKPLEMWGDSTVGRDIIYVKDVVDAFAKAILNGKARGLYNITSGRYLTLKEEVDTIARVFWGDDSAPVIIPRPDKTHKMDCFLYDNSKAREEFNWSPQYDFEKMLVDYQAERKRNKFAFLIEKRRKMFDEVKNS